MTNDRGTGVTLATLNRGVPERVWPRKEEVLEKYLEEGGGERVIIQTVPIISLMPRRCYRRLSGERIDGSNTAA